eukprot:TRINITY_DN6726_c0_g1_i2.p1 TRINITY_DN6726_c0_g1~~TRINITY_DN6726_c0_g1_i2.p1  ORF type:complete len:593 (-),score=115.97 TRINITY_DN6726_c0_g1_i2:252-2030(-)
MVAAGGSGQNAPHTQLSQEPKPLAPGLVLSAPELVTGFVTPAVEEGKPAAGGTKAPMMVPPPSAMLGKATTSGSAAGPKEEQADSSKHQRHDVLPVGALPVGVLPASLLRRPLSPEPSAEKPSTFVTPVLGESVWGTPSTVATTPTPKQSARNNSKTRRGQRSSTSPYRKKEASSPHRHGRKSVDGHKSPDGGVGDQCRKTINLSQMPGPLELPLPMAMPQWFNFLQAPMLALHSPDVTSPDQCFHELSIEEMVAVCVLCQKRQGRLSDVNLSDWAFGVDTPEKVPPQLELQDEEKDKCNEKSTIQRGQAVPESEYEVTTLLVQNLPMEFDQTRALEWLDGLGYRDLYDFMYYFGPKGSAEQPGQEPEQASQIQGHGSRAFVNFCSPEQASRFRKQLEHTPADPSSPVRLRITPAKIQGFAANFENARQNAKKDGRQPYMAKAALDAYSKTHPMDPVEKQLENSGWTKTTLMIRNLPIHIKDQSAAMKLLNQHGHAGAYDFFLFMPGKQSSRRRSAGDKGLGYIFVNFLEPSKAEDCLRTLHGKNVQKGEQPLSVVAAKIQGFDELQKHFAELAQEGRHVPWVKTGGDKAYQ